MSNNKQNSEEQNHGYICPVTKVQCDDECCVSAEDCHIKSGYGILSSNNKQSSVEWYASKVEDYLKETYGVAITDMNLLAEAKAMHNEEKLTNYSDGYLEGFNRALALIELTVEEYKHDIFYYQGLAKIYSRIKELRG